MGKNSIHSALKNYRDLLKRVDDHIRLVEKTYPDKIACNKGCDACCRFLTLLPVEATAVSKAFIQLPEAVRKVIVEKLKLGEETCPLLIDKACVLYPARPVICRTHGYPIFMEKDGETCVDFCPENFKGMVSFPKDVLLSIEQLNTTLIAVNRHFLASIQTDLPFPERIPISEALFILDEKE